MEYVYTLQVLHSLLLCELQCPDTYHPGTSDRCTIMWERLPTVSCSSLHVSVSLRQPDGAVVYSDVFSPSVSSTETTPLNPNTVYTVAVTAENVCGNTTCSTECSPGKHKAVYLSLWYALRYYIIVRR